MNRASLVPRIEQALADAHVDPSYVHFVLRHLDADDTTWRWCCGSNCDPCVEELGRVVDLARTWLGVVPRRPS